MYSVHYSKKYLHYMYKSIYTTCTCSLHGQNYLCTTSMYTTTTKTIFTLHVHIHYITTYTLKCTLSTLHLQKNNIYTACTLHLKKNNIYSACTRTTCFKSLHIQKTTCTLQGCTLLHFKKNTVITLHVKSTCK